ncbi:unnamed protein product [Cunninghamella blakesleeana]
MAWGGNDGAVEKWVKQLEENNPKLTSLHILSFRRISTQELTQIFKAIAKNSTLKELYCSGHALDCVSMDQLAETLTLNDTLECLNIGNATLGQDSNIFSILCEGLSVNEGLRTLDLENKGLNKDSLTSLIQHIKGHPTIEHVYLGRNEIDDDDMVMISQWLSHPLDHSTLKSLKLEMNQIGSRGAILLADALKPFYHDGDDKKERKNCVASFLKELDVSENSFLEGSAPLATSLLNSMNQLEVLKMTNVCTPKNLDDEDALKLPPSALDSVEFERELELQNEKALEKASPFGNDLLKAITQSLKKHTLLKKLWLNHNGIESVGLKDFDHHIQSLQELHLRENRINDEGAIYLSTCPSLKYIELGENAMGVDGLVHLLKESSSLENQSQLQHIGLFNNQVQHFGNDPIPKFENSKLQQLDLGGNGVTLKDASMMVNMLLDHGLPLLTLLELGGNAEDKDMDAWDDLFKTLKDERPQLQVVWKRLAKEMDTTKPPI